VAECADRISGGSYGPGGDREGYDCWVCTDMSGARTCQQRMDGQIHIPGVGDLVIPSAEQLPDPCPSHTRVSKMEKEKLLYPPVSDVGGGVLVGLLRCQG